MRVGEEIEAAVKYTKAARNPSPVRIFHRSAFSCWQNELQLFPVWICYVDPHADIAVRFG